MNTNNIAWKCRECGECGKCGKVTLYHPDVECDPKIEIRETTLCLKCLREQRV